MIATPQYYEVKESFNRDVFAGIEETKPVYFLSLSAV